MRVRSAVGLVLFVGTFMGGCDCPCKHRATTTPTTQASLAAPAPASVSKAAPGVAGSWSWSMDAGGTSINQSVVLQQNGEKLTGKFTDGYDNTTYDISDGSIHDGQVTFTVVRPFMDNGNLTLKFAGKFDGSAAIAGTVAITIADQPTTSDWNAKRGA